MCCDDTVIQEDEAECPAVIVEQVNSADVEQCYAAQVLVCDDENTYLMQDVVEEQVVETEVHDAGIGELFWIHITRLTYHRGVSIVLRLAQVNFEYGL